MKALETQINLFNEYLTEHPFAGKPYSLYEPVNYILSLGGKRVRPALVLLGAECFGGNMQDALPAAMSIELFHNFTLIHDDIMDVADIRRGNPTVHKKFGDNTAILSGDVMMVYAYEFLIKSPNASQTISVFNRTAIEVCEGQQYDMEFETRNDVDISEYIKMIELKTAVLLGGALEIGALIAGASTSDCHQIYEFGRNLGLAFQLKDDILDTFAENAAFGKKIGGDIVQNKKTYLLITAMTDANTQQKEELNHWLSIDKFSEEEKIASVKEVYKALDIQKKTEAAAEMYYNKALEIVDGLTLGQTQQEKLKTFAAQLLKRTV